MRKYICTIIAGVLLVNLSACSSKVADQPKSDAQSEMPEAKPEEPTEETTEKVLEGKTFRDPDSLINEFIKQAKIGDLDALTEFFAIHYVEAYNEQDEDADIVPPLSIEERTNEVYRELTKFYMGLTLPAEEAMAALLGSDLLENVTKENTNELLETGDYKTLEVARIDLWKQDQQAHDELTAELRSNEKLYKADGWDYRTVLLSMNGQTYCCCFNFIIYDGNYQLMSFSGALLYFDDNLATVLLSEEEYLEILR